MTKVLVIGLDGGTWNLIEPLAKEGKLPTIADLMKNGSYGDLKSTIPYITFPAWKCYSTGKNPGKIGIYEFLNVDIKKQKVIVNNSSHCKSKELWDYLSENNIVCGVLDMPTTYPPKKINGFMVSHSLVDVPDFTYPENLADELRCKFNYKLNPHYHVWVNKDLAIPEYKDIINQRFEVAKYLIERYNPSFLHVTIFRIDTIQHYFWKYMENDDPKYGKVIEDFWKLIDTGIKSLMNKFCDERTYVILMSDHGFTKLEGTFNIVRWLIKKKYLILKSNKLNLLNILFSLGVSSDRLISIITKLKIYPLLNAIIPYNLQKRLYSLIPTEKGGVKAARLESLIDWKKSKVISIRGIYINKDIICNKNYEKFRSKLINEMKNIRSPKGDKLFNAVYRKEEIYSGEYLNHAPDILTLINDNYEIVYSLSEREWDLNPEWSGDHKLSGIFCISGPAIRKNVRIQGATIYDLAPTILHILGIPIPKDMDGRVLKEIFEEGSELSMREVKYYEENERNKIGKKVKYLKGLGKI